MEFNFDLSQIPIIGRQHRADRETADKERPENSSGEHREGMVAASASHTMDSTVSDWKRAHLSQVHSKRRNSMKKQPCRVFFLGSTPCASFDWPPLVLQERTRRRTAQPADLLWTYSVGSSQSLCKYCDCAGEQQSILLLLFNVFWKQTWHRNWHKLQ